MYLNSKEIQASLNPDESPVHNIEENEGSWKQNSAPSINPVGNFLWGHCCQWFWIVIVRICWGRRYWYDNILAVTIEGLVVSSSVYCFHGMV